MNERLLSRASAGLGGMAIALLLVGLVVQGARAATPCEECQAWADQQALAACDQKGIARTSYECTGMRQGYRAQLCNIDNWQGTSSPACPGQPSPLKDCASAECSFFDVQVFCPEPYKSRTGGLQCHPDACIGKACGTPIGSGSSGGIPTTCGDVSVVQPGDKQMAASVCFWTCGCK